MRFEDIDLHRTVEHVLAGGELDRETARALLACPDERLDDLLAAVMRVREASFGRRVKLCVLSNAQSGICSEDCHYCSQSRLSRADIPVYRLKTTDTLLREAEAALQSGANRYCMVCSMRGPAVRDIAHLAETCEQVSRRFPGLELCLSLGLMSREQASELKSAGAGWINHNLNTSRRFYPSICTTHTWDDRVATIENVRRAGLKTCCGGIIGMGETDDDVLDLAYATRRLAVDSLPINFLSPIGKTPLESARWLTPERCLKAVCVFRLLNPQTEVRAAGGRELNLGARQPDLFKAVNSIFVNGYLTTPGWDYERTLRLIEGAGFEPEPQSA